ncbi:MAG TPA: CPBP family intramembrane glutamic endopeptidase [Xanthomonadaceae bacterium]|nr:CPBP family intramembrane glutamic endopeptidase [Xanthomonadaceae bacterium]
MEASDTIDAALADGGVDAPVKEKRPLRAFTFDAVMAIVLMLVISIGFGIAWGVVQGATAVMSGADAQDPEAIAAAIGTPGVLALLWMTALGTGGAALILYAWRRRATPAERAASSRAARQPATWKLAVLAAAAVFLMTSAMQWLMGQTGVAVEPSNLEIIREGLALHPAMVLLFAAIIAPAYEELLFRRVLFGRLLAAGKPWLGMVLSSLVFALMHEIPGASGNPIEATLMLWVLYGSMGAVFAWVYWKTGTLWAAFAAHGLHNLISCLVLVAGLG